LISVNDSPWLSYGVLYLNYMDTYRRLPTRFSLKVGSIVEVRRGRQRYVLVYRSQARNRGFLEITRGELEHGSLEQNVIRETREETGLRCRIIRPFLLNFYLAEKARYADCQIYFICRPIGRVDVTREWRHKDSDPHKHGRRWYTCHFVPVKQLVPAAFKNGQDVIIRHYLKT